MKRDIKQITSHSYTDQNGQGVWELIALAHDGTLWIHRSYMLPEWEQLPPLPEADDDPFNTSKRPAQLYYCEACYRVHRAGECKAIPPAPPLDAHEQ